MPELDKNPTIQQTQEAKTVSQQKEGCNNKN